jgi:aerobic carbon-monoxide dehydrogenase medium subunit
MRGIKEFLSPSSLDYALKLLDTYQGEAVILGGGTHLALMKKSSYSIIIDIKKAGLNYITEEAAYIRIGATTRAVDIFNSKILQGFAGGILIEAARKIGSPLTQNLVTIGGNVYGMFPWSNLPPALLVLDAEVIVVSHSGSRQIKLSQLLQENPRKSLKKNEIIAEILIPQSSKDRLTNYKTFSITETDYDLAIVAVGVDLDGNICKDARIAIGAAVSPFTLVEEAQVFLRGKHLSSDAASEAAQLVVEKVELVKDFRTSKEQLEATVKTLVRRSLEELKV